MKGRGLAIGAIVLGVVVLVLGLILQNQADFSSDYVRSQLAERGITFTPVEALLPAQNEVPCLVANAGKPLTTGKQAECYAKYQIGIDLTLVDGGHTYFESHYNGYLARTAAAAAHMSMMKRMQRLMLRRPRSRASLRLSWRASRWQSSTSRA